MDKVLTSLFMILAGGVDLYYATKFLRNKGFAEEYVKTSPKAAIWRKIFGVEKAVSITKKIFAPIGIMLGILLVLWGIINLIV
jgi:hypothetical protein